MTLYVRGLEANSTVYLHIQGLPLSSSHHCFSYLIQKHTAHSCLLLSNCPVIVPVLIILFHILFSNPLPFKMYLSVKKADWHLWLMRWDRQLYIISQKWLVSLIAWFFVTIVSFFNLKLFSSLLVPPVSLGKELCLICHVQHQVISIN